MTLLRPLGHWDSPPDERDVPFKSAVRNSASLPSESTVLVSAYKDVGPLFQYKAGTCVVQVIAGGTRTLWGLRYGLGKGTPTPARRGMYYGARALSGNQHSDDGCFPRLAFQAFDDDGFSMEESTDDAKGLPYDENKINDPIPAYAIRGAEDQAHVVRYSGIKSGLSLTVEQMKAALANSFVPVGFAIDVVTSFDNYRDGVWNPKDGETSRGGHYIMALGYSDALQAFLCANSWESFGIQDAGCSFIWVSYDVFRRGKARDIFAFDVAQLPSQFRGAL